MTAEQFAYWMQGFAELNPDPPTAAQWQAMREHLGTVFQKVTPPLRADPIDPSKVERILPNNLQAQWPRNPTEFRADYRVTC